MKQSCGLFLLVGIFISLGLSINADPTDFLRRNEDQEDKSEPTEQSDWLHETYTTKGGETKERFAPVENILGLHRQGRRNNNQYEEPRDRRDRGNRQ